MAAGTEGDCQESGQLRSSRREKEQQEAKEQERGVKQEEGSGRRCRKDSEQEQREGS